MPVGPQAIIAQQDGNIYLYYLERIGELNRGVFLARVPSAKLQPGWPNLRRIGSGVDRKKASLTARQGSPRLAASLRGLPRQRTTSNLRFRKHPGRLTDPFRDEDAADLANRSVIL